MDLSTADIGTFQQSAQMRPMFIADADESQTGCLMPKIHHAQQFARGGGIGMKLPVRHDREEFVNARPRNGPRFAARDQSLDGSACCVVPIETLKMRVNEDVGVDSNHGCRIASSRVMSIISLTDHATSG